MKLITRRKDRTVSNHKQQTTNNKLLNGSYPEKATAMIVMIKIIVVAHTKKAMLLTISATMGF